MAELESYAKYIEADFLQGQYYRLGLLVYHASTWEQVLRALVAMVVSNAAEAQEVKADQYTSLLDTYRARQVGGVPARFALDVASLPGGAPFKAKALSGG
jgi:hypothetical protein